MVELMLGCLIIGDWIFLNRENIWLSIQHAINRYRNEVILF